MAALTASSARSVPSASKSNSPLVQASAPMSAPSPAFPAPPARPLPPKPAPARLLLVRHGQSTWNRDHRIQGQLDPPLSEEGRRQAERLGRRWAGRRFVAAYTSDLKRALETAQLIGEATDAAP